MWETWVRSLSWEDPVEKGKAIHCSILAWRIPRTIHGVTKSRTWLSNFHFTSLHFTSWFRSFKQSFSYYYIATGWSSNWTQIQLLITQKSSLFVREKQLVEKETCFIQETSNLGRWQISVQVISQRTRAFKGKLAGCAGGCIQSSTVSSNSYLEPDVQGSSQHRLDFFSVQLIFDCMVSLSSFSWGQFLALYRLEIQNHSRWGSFCHDYSLVIMQLAFPLWWWF